MLMIPPPKPRCSAALAQRICMSSIWMARSRAIPAMRLASRPALSGFGGGKVQVGGGIRTAAHVEGWLAAGVWRVVMGTAALDNPDLVRGLAKGHPGRIVVAVDARDGMVATRGWADVSTLPVAELAKQFEDAGVAAVLFTDVGRDGMLKGGETSKPPWRWRRRPACR